MARKPRFTLAGHTQHIIQLGLDRQARFFAPPDCRLYLELLQEAAARHDCHVHAHVLMTNHAHLLVTPQQACGISFMMQRLSQRYVRTINRHYPRSGILWEACYKAGLVDTDRYLLACMRYIELNTVRAEMVTHPSDYAWSSYRHNGQDEIYPVITQHPLYRRLDHDLATRRVAYRALFSSHIEPELLDEIRQTVNQEPVLGTARFKQQIADMPGRQTDEKPRARPRKENDAGLY